MPPRLIIVAVLAALLLTPSRAHAGTYDVYSCRLPDGTRIPWDGWTRVDPTSSDNATAQGECEVTSLGAHLEYFSEAVAGSMAGWHFAAPQDTTIENFTIYRWAQGSAFDGRERAYDLIYEPPTATTSGWVESCSPLASCTRLGAFDRYGFTVVEIFHPSNRVERSGLAAHGVTARIRCNSPDLNPCARPYGSEHPGAFGIMSSRIGLEDAIPPVFSTEPAGRLASPAESLANEASVAFRASDRGSGIERAAISIDGKLYADRLLGSGTSCRRPFTRPVPCALHQDVSLTLDTEQLPDGEHLAQAVVWDAAGNAQRSAPWRFVTANRLDGAPATSLASTPSRFLRLRSWFSGKSRASQRTLKFAQRTNIEGVLSDASGAGVAAASLAVEERPVGSVAGQSHIGVARTDSKGRFSYQLRAGPSRVVEISHRVAASDPAPVAVARVTVRVRAGVTLRTSKRFVRNGTALRFSGRVLGERGARRAIVTIYALGGGRRSRIPVETVRANSKGRFSYTYRFGNIAGPSVYRFEARVPKQTGFPYLEGVSRRVTVRGRP